MTRCKKQTSKKWLKNKVDEIAVKNGCYFDEAAGERVCLFFETFLRHSVGRWAGQPFKLLDWQRDDLIMPLFGWKDKNGFRRFRTAYIEIPKKNGKSTLCAGLALYLLTADGEHAAEVYGAASDRAQASIVYREAARMVQQAPQLRNLCRAIDSKKEINFYQTSSVYKVLSSEAPRAEGLNIHGLIFDELHAQPNRNLFDTLRWGGAARNQPMLISITTAGYDRNSICYEQHDYAEKVAEGIIEDTSFFSYIRAAGSKDDWTNKKTWYKANPSLGATIKEDDFASDCKEAQENPRKENAFKRYRLNIWTEQAERWLSMSDWDTCPDAVPELDGCDCYGGLDLASTSDLCAFVLCFPLAEGGYFLLPRFYVPEDNASKRERRDRVPYLTWEKQGFLQLTPGNVVDYEFIRHDINQLGEKYWIREIAVDRWNSTQISTQLESDGHQVFGFGQGFASMSAPCKKFETLVASKKIYHGGNPVLRWNAANVSAKTDPAGNIKPDKEKSTEKIDGIVASIMALGRAMVHDDAGPSIMSF